MSVPHEHHHNAWRRLLRWTARLLVCSCAAAVLGAIAVTIVLPRAVHGQALTVLSGSMTPGIPVGSVVVVRPVDPGTLQVGDIATYQPVKGKDEYITHRVVKIDSRTTPTTFTFKGDANRGPDTKPVVPDQIRGEVWFHVPYLGAIRDALHGKGGFTLVAMLLLAGYAISQVGAGLRERRHGAVADSMIALDRPLVVAQLDTQALAGTAGQTPAEAAAAWSALLVAEDDDTCTLLVVPPSDGLAACLELLAGPPTRMLRVIEAGHLTAEQIRHVSARPRSRHVPA